MTENKSFLPSPREIEEITFSELPIPKIKDVSKMNLSEPFIHPVALIKTEKLFMALYSDISDMLLAKIMQEIAHA